MNQSNQQRFQRSIKSTSKNTIKEYTESSLVKNSIQSNLQTSPKKSQLSIDETYQFVISHKQVYFNVEYINQLVSKLKKVLAKKQLRSFYRIKLFKMEKEKVCAVVPFLLSISKSIENRKKCNVFTELKFNSLRHERKMSSLRNIASLYKKKTKQYLLCSIHKMKNNKISSKMQDYTKMKEKIQLSLSRNQHSTKSLQSISEIVNPKESKRLLSPRSMQKQVEFQKFAESISQSMAKQKDYQLAKINTQNLLKKFRLEEKFKDRLKVYDIVLDLIGQAERSTLMLKESNGVMYKMNSFLDPSNTVLSIGNVKQIKKEVAILRSKLQPNKKVESSGVKQSTQNIQNSNGTSSSIINSNIPTKKLSEQATNLQNIEKLAELLGSMIDQISLKTQQKLKLQQQHEMKLQSLMKEETELKKKVLQYQQNESLCQLVLVSRLNSSSVDSESLAKQLTDVCRKASNSKRRNEFPYTLFTKISEMMQQQKKSLNEFNSALKSLSTLYNKIKNNVTQQFLQEEKLKIRVKYESNEIFTLMQPNISVLIANVTQKERQINEVELKKVKVENQKLAKQLETERNKIASLKQTAQIPAQIPARNNKSTTQQRENINQQLIFSNKTLRESLQEYSHKNTALQQEIEQFQKMSLQNDLVNETLSNILTKIENHNDTWIHDVQVLESGKNKQRYELVFRVASIFKHGIEQYNKQMFSESFETLIYNSKKDEVQKRSHNIKENETQQLEYAQNNDHMDNVLQGIPRLSEGERYSERISWNLSQKTPQRGPKQTKSFILEQNLLQESGIKQMKESNLLESSNNLQYKGSANTFQMLLFNNKQQSNQHSPSLPNHATNIPIPPINLQEITTMNSILVKILSGQFSIEQVKSQQLPKLNNPHLANFVILLESFLNNQKRLEELVQSKERLEEIVRCNESDVALEVKLRQFVDKVVSDINSIENSIKARTEGESSQLFFEETYWNDQINSVNQLEPSIVLLDLSSLFKKLSHCIKDYIKTQTDLKKSCHNTQQQPLISKQQLQSYLNQIQQLTQSISHKQFTIHQQSELLISLERQMKQNELKYQSQLSYYQRLEQQTARSPMKQSIERTMRTSKSVRSLKSAQSSDSNTKTKYDDIKNHYKQSLQEMSKQQKRLLEQFQNLNIQKNNISADLEAKVHLLKKAQERILELSTELSAKERTEDQLKIKYEADFDSLKHDLEIVKLEVINEVQRKQGQIQYYKEAYDVLAKRYQQMLSKENRSESQSEDKVSQQQLNDKLPLSSSQLLVPNFNSFHEQKLYEKIEIQVKKEFQQRIFQLEDVISNLQKEKQLLQQELNLQQSQVQKLQQEKQLFLVSTNKEISFLKQQNLLLSSSKNCSVDKIDENYQISNKRADKKLQLCIGLNHSNNKIESSNKDLQINNHSLTSSLMHNNLNQNIQQVDQNTYVVTRQEDSIDNIEGMRQISQVQQLKMIIHQMESERNHIIESQVLKALKSQEEEFNNFYRDNMARVQEHFLKQIIPQKIKEVENQFYKHQTPSSVTQVSSSSVTLVPVQNHSIIPADLNQETYLAQKYDEWKNTYLPVILQLNRQQWLQQYESTELQKVLSKKYEQWQNIRLLSIIKEKKNAWILDQLFSERIEEWSRTQEELVNKRIHEVEQYWEQVVLPQRLELEVGQWRAGQEQIIRLRVKEVQEYYEHVVLPQKINEYHQTTTITTQQQQPHQLSTTQTSTTYTSTDLQRILQQEHQKWSLQFQNELQNRIRSLEQQWEATIIPDLKLQWENQYSKEVGSVKSSSGSGVVDGQQIQAIVAAKYEQWKQTYLPQYLRLQKIKWLQEFTQNELSTIIQKKQQEWETIRLLSIIKEPRNHWVIENILKEKYAEWESTVLLEQRRKWQEVVESKDKQLEQKTMSVVSQDNFEQQIKHHEAVWMQTQEQLLKQRISEVEKYWQSVLAQQRLAFETTLESALLVRTTQIETYWQTVMIPQLKLQWEHAYSQQTSNLTLNEQSTHKLQSIQQSTEQEQERVTQIINERLSIAVEQRLEEWRRFELPGLLELYRQDWEKAFLESQEFSLLLGRREDEWSRQKEQEFSERLGLLVNQQRQSLEGEIMGKVEGQYQAEISRLSMQLQLRSQSYSQLQLRYAQIQRQLLEVSVQKSTSQQSLSSKQAIYQLQTEHIRQINSLKVNYEERLSQLVHQKSLLTMQLKELEIQVQKLSATARNTTTFTNKETTISATIQANYEKQILSLQGSIKTKESEVNFLKKSIDSLSNENQELNSRILILNNKISLLEQSLDESKNQSIKFEYEIKYLKEKESSFHKKIEAKQTEYQELKSRLEFEKSLLQKKLRQLSNTSQSVSSLQLKLTELQSQLSIKHSASKSLQNELDRKKRELQEEKQRSISFNRDLEVYKTTIKQHESIIQDLRLEIRKSCDQINRQKLVIETNEQKERNWIQQVKKLESRTRDRSQYEELIRENERLKLQLVRMKEKLVYIESNEFREVHQLKKTIHTLEARLNSSSSHYREGDITEIEILKRINYEISDLVSTNKQLQMRIIVLENEKELSAFGLSIERFFVAFQQQMDNLVNYMISNQVWSVDSINSYNKFQQKSREALSHGYVEDYFRQWQAFMRGVIEHNYQQTVRTIKLNTGSKNSLKDDEVDDIVEKYDAVLNDVKFTLAEFLKSGDQEYLTLMSKSLGLEMQSVHESNGHVQERNGIHQERTLSRQ